MRFTKSFTHQAPLPDAAINAAERVLRSGRLHRYQVGDATGCDVAKLEVEFAQWQGARYCLALTSGGQAMQIAMRSVGVKPGDLVLTNAFTLAPVPGAIHAVGATPVLVETTQDLVIDLTDLESKAVRSKARVLMLSHMRGHLVNMDRLTALARRLSLTVIEDCAHTMGATWGDVKSGQFGDIACFSAQSYKHLNAGEGGLLTSNNPTWMARAILQSGSYMKFTSHDAAPAAEHFEHELLTCPNCSARMDVLRAAILRTQLPELDNAIARWNQLCGVLEDALKRDARVALPTQTDQSCRVGSSLQFSLPELSASQCGTFLERTTSFGLDIKWFGRASPHGFTSSHRHWQYFEEQPMPATDQVLATLFDIRLPLSFDESDCSTIAGLLIEALDDTVGSDRV